MLRILLLALLLSSSAQAQIYFQSPNGSMAPGALNMCLDGSAKSVPCGDAGNPIVVTGSVSMASASATPITASNTGTTAAVTATLAGAAAKTTYICGFNIDAGATVGGNGAASVANTITGTLNYIQGIGTLGGIQHFQQNFNSCIPASAVNTGITITSAAAGLGGTTAVTAWGYQQ